MLSKMSHMDVRRRFIIAGTTCAKTTASFFVFFREDTLQDKLEFL